MKIRPLLALAASASLIGAVQAQAPAFTPYGANITLDQARKVAQGASDEAHKRGWPMAIAIVDTAGQLVYFERNDQTQTASTGIAQDKAVSAAMLRRPTKAVQDAIAAGGAGLRYLTLHGVTAVEGGLPVIVGGKVIGAIGISGMASDQDGEIAKVGAEALK